MKKKDKFVLISIILIIFAFLYFVGIWGALISFIDFYIFNDSLTKCKEYQGYSEKFGWTWKGCSCLGFPISYSTIGGGNTYCIGRCVDCKCFFRNITLGENTYTEGVGELSCDLINKTTW